MHFALFPPGTEIRPLAVWAKVLLTLIALDLAIRGSDVAWKIPVEKIVSADEIQLGEAHAIGRRLVELSRRGARRERRVLITGSSLVEIGIGEETVEAEVNDAGLAPKLAIYKMAEFGAFPSDVFIITEKALGLGMDLVVYGASPRDYPLPGVIDPRASAVAQILGTDVRLEVLSPRTFEEFLTWQLRKYWLLYRYKPFFRVYARWQYRKLKGGVRQALFDGEKAWAGPRAQGVGVALAGRADDLWAFVARLEASKPRKYFEVQREINLRNYGPQGNPQLALVAQWARLCNRRGARPVIVLMPENPLLKSAPNPYFDPELSRLVGDRLKAIAEETGAGFHDLRFALEARHFQDFNHPNEEGAVLLSKRFAAVIAEEAARQSNMEGPRAQSRK